MSTFEPVIVRTHKARTQEESALMDTLRDNATAQKQIDWNDSSDRKWLVSHQHWAIMNGYAIVLIPEIRY
jgi:hypothetical protein